MGLFIQSAKILAEFIGHSKKVCWLSCRQLLCESIKDGLIFMCFFQKAYSMEQAPFLRLTNKLNFVSKVFFVGNIADIFGIT